MPIHNHISSAQSSLPLYLFALPLITVMIIYMIAAIVSSQKLRTWKIHRTLFWLLGIACALAAVFGPLANAAHHDFRYHMLSHLLIGMLAPVLLVFAAPMTLILRTIPVRLGRRFISFLNRPVIRIISHPISASLINLGSMWLLYTTSIYSLMHVHFWLHWFVHVHMLLAGFLYTCSIIYVDPVPHRVSFRLRACILLLSSAGHNILSKYIYAHPPTGVDILQAEAGAVLMYYGGDIVDVILITILCSQWYKSVSSRSFLSRKKSTHLS
ncbi:cytochrome c oxidase assembly protein [Paenibacillus sp. PDC88]|uniref:cytochrome c oxidase assembly protein n=1 Tax=Paenibacillus sp. PDC88 TaxID=1884375 RepID=UPI000895BA53|nr:cytochrome c oxidase assembly protein [Paenibacillus sp. PDC88]SDW05256.1 putative membrane protein [Paenibacillus sp. PDC88]